MKILIGALLVITVCTAGHAATLQWEYAEGSSGCYQLVADGGGGCAVVLTDPASIFTPYKLVWLDKSGATRYFRVGLTYMPIIVSCEKQWLVFSGTTMSGFNYITPVDKHGVEQSGWNDTGAPCMTATPPLKLLRLSDSKGFFAEKLVAGVYTIQRYSYK